MKNTITETLKEKRELQRQVLNAHAGKDLHAEYLKLPKKKQEKSIDLCLYLRETGEGMTLSPNRAKRIYARYRRATRKRVSFLNR